MVNWGSMVTSKQMLYLLEFTLVPAYTEVCGFPLSVPHNPEVVGSNPAPAIARSNSALSTDTSELWSRQARPRIWGTGQVSAKDPHSMESS